METSEATRSSHDAMQVTNTIQRVCRLRLCGFALSLVIITLLFAAPSLASAATIPVTNTSDSGAGSLRDAIAAANVASDVDTISFNIPSTDPNCNATTGVCTITLSSTIHIFRPVIINGYSQPGASPNTNPITAGSNAVLRIEIRGVTGNNFTASSSTEAVAVAARFAVWC